MADGAPTLLGFATLSVVLCGGGASAREPQREAVEATSWVSGDEAAESVQKVFTPGLDQRLFAIPPNATVIAADSLERGILAALREHGAGGKLLASVHIPLAPRASTDWQRIGALEGPSSWRLAIVADGATFLRPHFVDLPPGDEARVAVYGGSPDQPAALVRPSAGVDGWGPVVEGPVLFVEVVSASGARPSLAVDVVSAGIPRARRTAADCYLDPSCDSAWNPIKSGIGRLYFEEGGQGYVCSGALLTDRSHTGRPYFLTAHHCLEEDRAADTALVFWNYHTSACQGLVPSLGSVPRTAGSSVLATGTASDFTLLLLDGAPPPGTAFLGWTTQALVTGAPVAVMHHPMGDWKRISYGKLLESGGKQKFWLVGLAQGAVEGGSSGAPLFSASQQVVGQLLGGSGNGVCDNPQVIDEFGRFSVSWAEGLSRYLGR